MFSQPQSLVWTSSCHLAGQSRSSRNSAMKTKPHPFLFISSPLFHRKTPCFTPVVTGNANPTYCPPPLYLFDNFVAKSRSFDRTGRWPETWAKFYRTSWRHFPEDNRPTFWGRNVESVWVRSQYELPSPACYQSLRCVAYSGHGLGCCSSEAELCM
jgi:hypothetical protein